jgi:LacI family xylobiose transport system transcriptional regulator
MSKRAAAVKEPKTTLLHVAELAGVSVSTVSKVLNGRGGVSDETRERIEGLLGEGFSRKISTRAVSPLIELLFMDIDGAWGIEILRGVQRVAREHGMDVVVSESGYRRPPTGWVDRVLRRRALGAVLVLSDLAGEDKARLRMHNVPFVMVDPIGDSSPDVPSVGSANWSGGLTATRHLLDLGHRDIAVITGPRDLLFANARLAGYRSAMESAGITPPEEYVIRGELHHDNGVAFGRQLLSLPDPPTAVFVASDPVALGVYEAARQRGLEIPRDLSVVGYDDLPIAAWANPPLTTVHQPLIEMAGEAVKLLFQLRDGGAATPRVELATDLVVRDSTRPL